MALAFASSTIPAGIVDKSFKIRHSVSKSGGMGVVDRDDWVPSNAIRYRLAWVCACVRIRARTCACTCVWFPSLFLLLLLLLLLHFLSFNGGGEGLRLLTQPNYYTGARIEFPRMYYILLLDVHSYAQFRRTVVIQWQGMHGLRRQVHSSVAEAPLPPVRAGLLQRMLPAACCSCDEERHSYLPRVHAVDGRGRRRR